MFRCNHIYCNNDYYRDFIPVDAFRIGCRFVRVLYLHFESLDAVNVASEYHEWWTHGAEIVLRAGFDHMGISLTCLFILR